MTNEIVPFQFDDVQIRTAVDGSGEPWFVAKDVAEALGYNQTSDALAHAKAPANLPELNQISGLAPATKWVKEPDVYRMVMRSNLPDAARFQDWVCEEVLPQIRKTGAYAQPQTTGDALVAMAMAYREHERRIMALESEQDQHKQAIAELLGGDDYATAKGYARTNKLPADRGFLNKVGRRAAAMCRERGIRIGRVVDEVWGEVNSYPRPVLSAAFSEMM
jgi:prophage antirepressor-like protein